MVIRGVISMNAELLQGLKVIEIGDELTQYTGKLLANMGAEVIKIEPLEGVNSRRVRPFYKDEFDINQSLYFWHYNTNKKSVRIDITLEENKEEVYKLISGADVVLEGNKPGELKKYDLDYHSLKKLFPELIYCSITPFGQDGPWKDYKFSDLTQLALGGIMHATGYDDVPNSPPIAPTGGQSVHLAGHFAMISILTAVLHKDIFNEGQFIDISTHECITTSTEMSIPYWEYREESVIRQTGRHGLPHFSTPFNVKCKDGKYVICLMLYFTGDRWKRLVEWLDSHNMAFDLTDKKYEDNVYRAKNKLHIFEVIERFCAQHDSDYIVETAQSYQFPWALIRAPEDMLKDKHIFEDRDAFVKINHPEINESFYYPGPPVKFNKTPLKINKRAPLLGEHNSELLEMSKVL